MAYNRFSTADISETSQVLVYSRVMKNSTNLLTDLIVKLKEPESSTIMDISHMILGEYTSPFL